MQHIARGKRSRERVAGRRRVVLLTTLSKMVSPADIHLENRSSRGLGWETTGRTRPLHFLPARFAFLPSVVN
jgi:hypothetical protein